MPHTNSQYSSRECWRQSKRDESSSHPSHTDRAPTGPASTRRIRTPQRAPAWLTLATLCTAVLIAQIDTSVVNLAVRPIGQHFRTGTGTLQWVLDGYNLVYAVLLLTGGLLADLLGRRRIFMAGAAVFTGASLLCALAPAVSILIGGRALAGLGAALLLPASLAIIRVVWPDPSERGKVLGIWAGCNGLAFALGPPLGGVLIHYFGWRAVFLVVVPLGSAALALAALAVPESSDPKGRTFDATGQMLGAMTIGGLTAAAIELHRAPAMAFLTLASAMLTLALFIRAESHRGNAALVPLKLFRVREFRGAMTATAGMTFGMYGVIFLLPFVWQGERTLGPVGAGVALAPMALVFALASPFSGTLQARLGACVIIPGGITLIGAGLLAVGLSASSGSLGPIELGLTLAGLGMGLATGPLMGVAVGATPANRAGTAASLINVARMNGATLGVAILGTAFAAAGGGPHGLSLAMGIGGSVQLASAAVAWVTMRPLNAPARLRRVL